MSQAYTHRNGETEHPRIAGFFWFKGNINREFNTEGIEPVYIRNGTLEVIGDDHGFYLENCTGQWWGPITPPSIENER